jgi:hypothetical protein
MISWISINTADGNSMGVGNSYGTGHAGDVSPDPSVPPSARFMFPALTFNL